MAATSVNPQIVTAAVKATFTAPLDKSNLASGLAGILATLVSMGVLAAVCGPCALTAAVPGALISSTVAMPLWAYLASVAAGGIVKIAVSQYLKQHQKIADEIASEIDVLRPFATLETEPVYPGTDGAPPVSIQLWKTKGTDPLAPTETLPTPGDGSGNGPR